MNKEELVKKVWESLKSSKAKAKKYEDNVLVSFSLISEESDDNIYVIVRDGVLSVEPYRYTDNNCEVEATAETVAKMFAGELSFEEALKGGFAKVQSGDTAKLMALEALVPSKKAAKTAKTAKTAGTAKAAAKPAAKAAEKKETAKPVEKAAKAEEKPAARPAEKAPAKSADKPAAKAEKKEAVPAKKAAATTAAKTTKKK